MVEGRDGANGRFVNEEYPIRAESSATSFVYGEETVKVTDSFAKYMSIPANGFAIVVQTNYAGSGFDADGRSFIAKNVIYQYGAVVQLYMEGSEEAPLTTYKDPRSHRFRRDDHSGKTHGGECGGNRGTGRIGLDDYGR